MTIGLICKKLTYLKGTSSKTFIQKKLMMMMMMKAWARPQEHGGKQGLEQLLKKKKKGNKELWGTRSGVLL